MKRTHFAVAVLAAFSCVATVAAPAMAAPTDDPPLIPIRSAPYNLGGTIAGQYEDSTGTSYDGSGTTIVDIDGAFDLTDSALASQVIGEYCFGQLDDTFGSLCSGGETVTRSETYPGSGLPDQSFVRQEGGGGSGVSAPSNGASQTCSDDGDFCHAVHGTMTAGLLVGQPRQRVWRSVNETQPYSGVAPGAKLIAMKVGTGKTGPMFETNSILNALLETEKLVKNPDTAELKANPIVAVNISNSGMYGNRDNWSSATTCTPGSPGAKIDAIAQRLATHGVAVVISAGNEGLTGGSTPYTCGKSIVPSGATEIEHPTMPTAYSNVLDMGWRTLYAPVGYGEWAPTANTMLTYYPGGASTAKGTSFSAPQIAAAFAVLADKAGSPRTVTDLNMRIDALQRSGAPITGERADQTLGGRTISIPDALNRLP